jgi:hypothetical protein
MCGGFEQGYVEALACGGDGGHDAACSSAVDDEIVGPSVCEHADRTARQQK